MQAASQGGGTIGGMDRLVEIGNGQNRWTNDLLESVLKLEDICHRRRVSPKPWVSQIVGHIRGIKTASDHPGVGLRSSAGFRSESVAPSAMSFGVGFLLESFTIAPARGDPARPSRTCFIDDSAFDRRVRAADLATGGDASGSNQLFLKPGEGTSIER